RIRQVYKQPTNPATDTCHIQTIPCATSVHTGDTVNLIAADLGQNLAVGRRLTTDVQHTGGDGCSRTSHGCSRCGRVGHTSRRNQLEVDLCIEAGFKVFVYDVGRTTDQIKVRGVTLTGERVPLVDIGDTVDEHADTIISVHLNAVVTGRQVLGGRPAHREVIGRHT